MEKVLYLSIDKAQYAIKSKDRLEALAFSLIVKCKFNSSRVNDASIRNCKKLFKIGTTRMSRILKNSIEFGYMRRDGNCIVSNSIKSKGYNIRLSIPEYTISWMMDVIRESVLLNHFKIQNRITDTLKSFSDPKNLKEYKSARRRIKQSMPGIVDYGCDGTSTARIMEVLNTKRTKARNITKRLVFMGKLKVKHRAKKTDINPNDFDRDLAKLIKIGGYAGYLFKYRGAIWQKVSNKYIYDCADICKI